MEWDDLCEPKVLTRSCDNIQKWPVNAGHTFTFYRCDKRLVLQFLTFHLLRPGESMADHCWQTGISDAFTETAAGRHEGWCWTRILLNWAHREVERTQEEWKLWRALAFNEMWVTLHMGKGFSLLLVVKEVGHACHVVAEAFTHASIAALHSLALQWSISTEKLLCKERLLRMAGMQLDYKHRYSQQQGEVPVVVRHSC